MSKMPHASPYSGRIAENCVPCTCGGRSKHSADCARFWAPMGEAAVPMTAREVQGYRTEGLIMHMLYKQGYYMHTAEPSDLDKWARRAPLVTLWYYDRASGATAKIEASI